MSEVRALLLTDVVDSTKLSEKIGDAAMAEVWAAHDRVARDLLPEWHGREIDKTDGMLFMFEQAADAVSYALAYHHALDGLAVPLKARAGLHVGPVILRENSAADVALGAKLIEVDGLAKPTAARVMSLARGGQILLTPEARQALGQTALKVESHGYWMVKGVADPIELFEAGAPDQRFVPPPDSDKVYRVIRQADWWLPVKEIQSNLPFQGTSFIGRERELDQCKALLKKARLLTLLGMGGLGKTRLSLQIAAETLHEYPDGAWFLDLAPIRDSDLVVSEAAQVLDVREEPDRPLIQTLCAYLKQRRVLLIIDNCEHLIKACADLAHAILKSAPSVRIVASSREALHVPGEYAYPILPLPVPQRGDGIDALSKSAAVRLFVERAQQHKPSFALTEKEAPAIAELVSRLEGIPLALELAAARVRSLAVAEINNRLKDRYKLLTGGARVLQERQQTLRALVDWSYELLKASEQAVLDRLGVFVGGFDLAAAESICGAEPIDNADVLDLLGSLVEKSLVMLDESGEAPRYRMLETIREYAQEKLDQRGERLAIATRHCMHFFGFAKQVRSGLIGPEQAQWVKRAEADLDNMRSAIALSLSGGIDAVLSVKFCVALDGFWTMRGYATEGRSTVRAALALAEVQASDVAQAHALYVGAGLATDQSDHDEARQMLESCLTLRRRLGNTFDIAATLSTLSPTLLLEGDVAGATVSASEALEIFCELGDRINEAVSRFHLGQIALYSGDHAQARECLEHGLSIARETAHQEAEAACELVLGETALEVGDTAKAGARFARSLAVCRDTGDKRGEACALWRMGQLGLARGAFVEARGFLSQALSAFRSFGMAEEVLGCLEDHASCCNAAGSCVLAAQLAAVASMLRGRLRLARAPRLETRWQAQLDAISKSMLPDAFEAALAQGMQWALEHAVARALAACEAPTD